MLVVLVIIVLSWYFFVYNKKPNNTDVDTNANTVVDTNVDTNENKVLPLENYPEWYATDKDHDGLADEEEDARGLDKLSSDSDGDSISDKAEIEVYKTDPLKPDTDGDGFWDAVEIINGYNPNGDGKL